MYRASGLSEMTDGSAQLSFRLRADWEPVFPGVLSYNAVLLGTELSSPMVNLIACEPAEVPLAPAHGHASDSLRLCIKGHQLQGRKSYAPGEFRFQEGWVPYADEGFGSDGMWGIIMLADRRGSRARLVDPRLSNNQADIQFRVSQKDRNRQLGIGVDDMLSDDPAETAGTSAIATTLGDPRGKLDGTFADRSTWLAIGGSTQIVVALMGDPRTGPVVVLAATEPGAVATPRCRFDTELLRLVVSGSAVAGGRAYAAGDAVLHDPGLWCDQMIAGPEGLEELIVLADRRGARPQTHATDAAESWPAQVASIVQGLMDDLVCRPPSTRSEARRLAALHGRRD